MIRWVRKHAATLTWVVAIATFGFLFVQAQIQRDDIKDTAATAARSADALEREVERSAREDCVLYGNEYENDRREYRDELRRLNSTLDYLRDLTPAEEAEIPKLLERIRENLPSTRRDVARARREFVDSVPPDYCDRFNSREGSA